MRWIVAAPFIKQATDTWLAPFVRDSRHSFDVVPAKYDHDRSRQSTNASQWLEYLAHGRATWSTAQNATSDTGVITLFPQLAVTVGLHKSLSQKRLPVLAWTFNLGDIYGGAKKKLARFALHNVDLFLVHSRREIESYSEWLDLPPEKFRFIPLQRPVMPIIHAEDEDQPFVLSMGSAHRDYRLFFEVMADLAYPTIVVAGPSALEGLSIPSNVKVPHKLNITQCHELAQKARINVVPIDNSTTASGQVPLLDSMMFARPTVATLSIGTEDYVEDGITALLVKAGERNAMKSAIQSLWDDKPRREILGLAARRHVETNLSDEAAGRALKSVLDETEHNYMP